MSTNPMLMMCLLVCAGCASAKVAQRHESSQMPLTRPGVILVSDFLLCEQTSGPEAAASARAGASTNGACLSTNAAQTAVSLMSEYLVRNLDRSGLPVRRLLATEPKPAAGWWVQGSFTEVAPGNRFQRVVVGLGAGAAKLQAHVALFDLARHDTQPFYEFDTGASTGERPGAALSLNPVRIPIKVARRWRGLDKEIKLTAKAIAAEVLHRARSVDTTGK